MVGSNRQWPAASGNFSLKNFRKRFRKVLACRAVNERSSGSVRVNDRPIRNSVIRTLARAFINAHCVFRENSVMGIRLPPPRRLLDICALSAVEEGALVRAGDAPTRGVAGVADVAEIGAVRIGCISISKASL